MNIYQEDTLQAIVNGYSRRILSSSVPEDVLHVVVLFYDNLFVMWNKELFGEEDVEFIGNRIKCKAPLDQMRTVVSDITISSEVCKSFSISFKMHQTSALIGFIPKDVPKKFVSWFNTAITSGP